MNLSDLQLFSATSWSWIESLSSYPASEYSLKLILKQGLSSAITINGIVEDDSFSFVRTSLQNASLPFGNYSYQFIATKENENFLVEQGTIQIYPLLSQSGDTRSYWEIIRDNAKECYRKLSTREVDSITTEVGDTVTYMDRAKLLRVIRNAENEIAREQGTSGPTIFKSRFI